MRLRWVLEIPKVWVNGFFPAVWSVCAPVMTSELQENLCKSDPRGTSVLGCEILLVVPFSQLSALHIQDRVSFRPFSMSAMGQESMRFHDSTTL